MPFLIALAGIIVALLVWANRARAARDALSELSDMANDVRLTARRFGFNRQSNLHPVESVTDPNLAITSIAIAYLELNDLPTSDQRDRLTVLLRSHLRLSAQDAQEAEVLGRWLMTECGGPDPAIARISRKLFQISGSDHAEPLLNILRDMSGPVSAKQKDALEDIIRALRPR